MNLKLKETISERLGNDNILQLPPLLTKRQTSSGFNNNKIIDLKLLALDSAMRPESRKMWVMVR